MKRWNKGILLVLGVLTVMAVALSGCGAPASSSARPAAAAPATAATLDLPVTIDAKTVNELRNNPDVFIIDVREDYEYAAEIGRAHV